jgi:hypothetical protein
MATRYLYLATDEFNPYFEQTYDMTTVQSVQLWDAVESAAIGAEDMEGDLLTTETGGQAMTFRFEFAYDSNSCVVRIATEIPGSCDEHVREVEAKQRRTR